MKKYATLFLMVFGFLVNNVNAQSEADSTLQNKEFINLDEALQHPEDVYRLNLSNQQIELPDSMWAMFTNIRYLSLKNDHLKEIPLGVGYLKTLQVLDLSGNDFKVLPTSFRNLTNLQELFMNDDKYIQLEKIIPVLSEMPSLRTLHLENDGLNSLPQNTFQLKYIEKLYLNDNLFRELPVGIKGLDNLKYIDFHNNKFLMSPQDIRNQNFGFTIGF